MNRRTIYTLAALALAAAAGGYAAESADTAGMEGPGMEGPGMGGPGMGGPGMEGPGMEGRGMGHHGMGGWGMHRPGMLGRGLLGRMGDELGLSADQKIQIFAIFEKARPQMKAIREQMRKAHEQLAGMDPGDPNYATAVASASKAAGEAASRLVTQTSQMRSAVWNVLTPDQRVKAKEMRAKFRDRIKARWQQRSEHGGGDRDGGEHRRGDGPPPPPVPPHGD
jgi:Spy/CpxP family protein refolding chaperone